MQPAEERARRPGVEVDDGGEVVRHGAADVVGEAAAGDVRRRVHAAGVAEVVQHGAVDGGGREQHVAHGGPRLVARAVARAGRDAEPDAAALADEVAGEVDGVLLEQVADEAEAVAVHAGGVDADEDVALLDELRAPELVALGDADGEAGHVEVAAGELPGVLGGLAAEQHALGAARSPRPRRRRCRRPPRARPCPPRGSRGRRAGTAPQADTSLTLIATRSMPMVSSRPMRRAISILVPTPSVPATRTGSLRRGRRMAPPKPPRPPRTSGFCVLFSRCFRRSTARLPASTSTPACLYVNRCSSATRAPRSSVRSVYVLLRPGIQCPRRFREARGVVPSRL